MGQTKKWIFQAVPGYFESHADIAKQLPNERFITQPRLALLSREYPTDTEDMRNDKDWERFANHVRSLNRDAPANVSYKVLYLTRHGFGYHNQKHREVGTEAWDSYWSLLKGDDKITWFDSFLNKEGVQQAEDLGEFWRHGVAADGMPIPQTLYTSPLARCLQTTEIVFSRLMRTNGALFCPAVKEQIRERFTVHTCDLRRPRTWIEQNYPGYTIEANVTEEDQFSGQTRWETRDEHNARKQEALEQIFSSDQSEFVSLTVHSFAIEAILEVCSGEEFRVREGTSLALLVRGEECSAPIAEANGIDVAATLIPN